MSALARLPPAGASASCPGGTRGRGLTSVNPITHDVSFEEATFCTLATTVLNGVRMGEPALGEAAVVIGQGLLGQLAAQYLRLAGCHRVIALDVVPRRLDIAQRAGGGTHVVNPAHEDADRAVRDLTAGRGADVVYEVTGRTETYDLAFSLARTHGRVVGPGSPRQPAGVDMSRVHIKALRWRTPYQALHHAWVAGPSPFTLDPHHRRTISRQNRTPSRRRR